MSDARTQTMSLRQAFDLAVQHHQAGRLDPAETIYRQILGVLPTHADSVHLLGVIATQRGQHAEAVARIEQAIALHSGSAPYYSNLGVALRALGRREEAALQLAKSLELDPSYHAARKNLATTLQELNRWEEAELQLRELIRQSPENAGAHKSLGVALMKQGRKSAAAESFEACRRNAPNDIENINNLCAALRETGRPAEAEPILLAAIQMRPDFAETYNNLGLALAALHRLPDSEAALRKAVAIDPRHVLAHNSLAVTLKLLGKISDALQHLKIALNLDPRYVGALNNVGEIYNSERRYAEAEKFLRKAVDLDPNCYEALNNLGMSLKEQERVDEANEMLVRALKLQPDYVPALVNYGNNLISAGDVAEGNRHFLRALEIKPDSLEAYYSLASHGRHRFTPAQVEMLRSLLARGDLSPADSSLLHFALTQIYDKAGPPEEAFAHALQANAQRKDDLLQKGIFHDPAKHEAYVDRLIQFFTPEFFAAVKESPIPCGSDDEMPVFVVGMPRSSTTLIEQIICSHPAAFGGGELNDIPQLAQDLPAKLDSPLPYPDCLLPLAPQQLRELAGDHLRRLQKLGGDASRVVDKMTISFLQLGLIAVLFPRAKIVHCQRDPRDTCLSCFFHNFAAPGLAFTFSLTDLGHYYSQYLRIMEHWRRVLPIPMLEMPYEQLTQQQEAMTRRLIEFVGLPWDDRCLSFHENTRQVKTASALQVREPMNNKSIGRWKKYESQLAPLLLWLPPE